MKFSFLERPQFTKKIIKLIEDEDYFELQDFLLDHPDWGDVIPRLAYPIRKIRWKLKGRGKRGGIRVVYFLAKSDVHYIFRYLGEKRKGRFIQQ